MLKGILSLRNRWHFFLLKDSNHNGKSMIIKAIKLRDPSFYLQFLYVILTIFTEITDRVFVLMLEPVIYFL